MTLRNVLYPTSGYELPANTELGPLTTRTVGADEFQEAAIGFGDASTYSRVTGTNGLPVKGVASEAHLGELGGNSDQVAVSFARPAGALTYAKGQAIQTATPGQMSFAVARIAGGSGGIYGARLTKTGLTVGMQARLYLFRTALSSPPIDGAAFNVAGLAGRCVLKVDFTIDEAYTDGAEAFTSIPPKFFRCNSPTVALFGYLVAQGPYAAAANEAFEVTLEVSRD